VARVLSPVSIRLGRLILEIKNPQQDFHDPFPGRPTEEDFAAESLRDWETTNVISKNKKLQSYLSDALNAFGGTRETIVTKVKTHEATTHELLNSGSWFNNACQDAETRAWIEKAIDEDSDVYLIVGTLVVRDATVSRTVLSRTQSGLGMGLSANALSPGVAVDTAINLATGVNCRRDTSYGQMTVFQGAGDQIIGFRYRKLKFKWFRSRSISSSFLEQGTRWKSDCVTRGEDAGEEDPEDVEDIVDADFEDIDYFGMGQDV